MPREITIGRCVIYGLAILPILAAWVSLANAQAVVWNNLQTGPTAGVWSISSNWTPAMVPGPLSTAQINNGGEARITGNVSPSRIEVGKNGGTGILTSLTSAVSISTDSDFDIGEIGGDFASGPIIVNGSGAATISDATILNIGTGGAGDLDIGQTSATLGAQAVGVGTLTLERVGIVQVTENVEIGKKGGSATADGEGDLVVDAVGALQIGVDLDIGQAGGTGQATGNGSATITNTPSIVVGLGIDVGRTTGSTTAANRGSGNLNISDATISVGLADSSNPGSMNIGGASTTTDQVANADGAVTLERVSLDVGGRIKVGELSGLGTAPATTSVGTLNLIDSDVSANRLEVATAVGGTAGTVQGTVHLESSFVRLDSALTLGLTSLLEFGLAGTTKSDGSGAAGHFGAIDADNVVLNGELKVFLVDGFSPALGDTFQIITGTRTGTLSPVAFPSLPTGLSWDLQFNPDSVVLQVLASLTADFDHDGNVNGDDLTKWETAFGASAEADADGDGDGDGNDFLAWQQQFGILGALGLEASVSTRSTLRSVRAESSPREFEPGRLVPEPTTRRLGLFSIAVFAGGGIRLDFCRRRTSRWEGY